MELNSCYFSSWHSCKSCFILAGVHFVLLSFTSCCLVFGWKNTDGKILRKRQKKNKNKNTNFFFCSRICLLLLYCCVCVCMCVYGWLFYFIICFFFSFLFLLAWNSEHHRTHSGDRHFTFFFYPLSIWKFQLYFLL